MTITQIEYILAVDTHGSFNVAAKKCFVSQPTLSMQIQKLEEELGVRLFQRAKQPVVPTRIGVILLAQARIVLSEFKRMYQLMAEQEQTVEGELSVGIIPTVSPYILPRLITMFKKDFPKVKLVVWEQPTANILQQTKTGMIDCGIVSAPVEDDQVILHQLFTERFVAYTGDVEKWPKDMSIDPKLIKVDELWLLDEGHCMRDQVLNFCQIRDRRKAPPHYEYKTGSIETLKKMVDENNGTTILPELAIHDLPDGQWERVRYFKSPAPRRNIGLVTQRSYVKHTLVGALKAAVMDIVSGRLAPKIDEHGA